MYKSIFLIFILFFGTTAYAEITSVLKELTVTELAQLEAGGLILKTKDIKGSPWPEITLYTLVEATPIEVMGIFSALDYQKDYVPNVIKSKPIKHLSPTEVLTEYEMHVPFPLKNALYTHGSIVHQYNQDYELSWYRVESNSTDLASGSAYFSPYKKITIFRYISYIRPKSIFGSLVKRIMFRDVQNTILSIRAHIEKLKKENSPLLYKYSGFISRALQGEFVYKESIEQK
ncbi:MAG: hypothetical protein PHY93_17730 [Bacteriovorax sp.]|nr:hypothetical protein [Bacteriovorax sp.]